MIGFLKRKEHPGRNGSNSHKTNAMIFVERTKKRIFRYLPDKNIPMESFPRDHKKGRLHVLGLDLEGKLWAIAPPLIVKAHETPTAVFIAKHCAEEVNEFYGLSSSMMQKIKLGIFGGLIFAIIIVIFLIVSSVSGGKVA